MTCKLFFFACALNLFYHVPNLLASPIIGGKEDTFHAYKYHVSVQENYDYRSLNLGEHLCGGTIIDDRYILSVAHCYFLKNGNGGYEKLLNPISHGVVVLSGTSETNGPGIVTAVAKIFIPRAFRQVQPPYADISVLKLWDSLDVLHNKDRLQIALLDPGYPAAFFVDKNAVIVGQGCDTLVPGYDGVLRPVLKPAKRRRYLEVHMLARNRCPDFDHKICAMNVDTSHIHTCCNGDSGSPVVYKNLIIGVVSQGPIYFTNRDVITSTRVSAFYNFILTAMNEGADQSQMIVLEN